MTSGLTYNTNTPAFEKARQLTDGKMDTVTVIKCLAQDPLSFEPGEKWVYSLSHDVLGAVVEVISGKKFRDYVKENIFLPLDMQESCFHNDSVQDRMAQQYQSADFTEDDLSRLRSGTGGDVMDGITNVGKNVVGHVFGSEYDSGGAGITTSVPDYSKFVSRGFASKEEAMKDKRVTDMVCYKCRRMLRKRIRWFSYGQRFYLCLAACPEHGLMKGKIRMKKAEDGSIFVVKTQKLVGEEGAEFVARKKEEARVRRAERLKTKKHGK